MENIVDFLEVKRVEFGDPEIRQGTGYFSPGSLGRPSILPPRGGGKSADDPLLIYTLSDRDKKGSHKAFLEQIVNESGWYIDIDGNGIFLTHGSADKLEKVGDSKF